MTEGPGGPRARWRREPLWLLAALLALANLLPLFAVPDPPFQDYPNHLVRARIFRDYDEPSPGYAAHYVRSWLPVPYVLGDLPTVALAHLVSLRMAGKLVLALAVTLVPLSVIYLLGGIAREKRLLGLAAFPAAYHWPLHMGFVTYSLSLAPAFFALGWWFRRRSGFRRADGAVLAALSLLAYLGHLFTFFVLAVLLVVASLLEPRRRHLFPAVAASLAPTVLIGLLVRALETRGGAEGPAFVALIYDSLERKWLAAAEIFVALAPRSESRYFLVLALFLAPFVLAGLRRPEARRPAALALAAATLVVAFPDHLATSESTLGFVAVRVPLVLAALLLALGTPPQARWGRRAVAAVLVVFALVRVSALASTYRAVDRGLASYRAVLERLPEDARPRFLVDKRLGRTARISWAAMFGNSFFLRSSAPRVPSLEAFVGTLRPIAYRQPAGAAPSSSAPETGPPAFGSALTTRARALLVLGDVRSVRFQRAATADGFDPRWTGGPVQWLVRARHSDLSQPSSAFHEHGFTDDVTHLVVFARRPTARIPGHAGFVEVFADGPARLLRRTGGDFENAGPVAHGRRPATGE